MWRGTCATISSKLLLSIDGKTKDNLNARRDLETMHIRDALHPITREDGKVILPATCHTMSVRERDIFCKVLHDLKVPDGYSSNISRCINLQHHNITQLKSYDCHILMQQLLSIALWRFLPVKIVCSSIIELCNFYRSLCSKEHKREDFETL